MRASQQERTRSEALPLAASYSPGGYFLSPKTAGEAMPMNDTAYGPSGKSFSPQASVTAKLWEPRHLFGASFLHLPCTYSSQSNPSAALSAEFREDGRFLMSNVKSQLAKCSFDNTLKACIESFFEVPTGHKGNLMCFNLALNFQLPVL